MAQKFYTLEIAKFKKQSVVGLVKEKNFITTARTGNSSIYFVNANIAWSTYGNKKEYSRFNASILISKSEQEYRIKASKFKQLDLLETKKDNNENEE